MKKAILLLLLTGTMCCSFAQDELLIEDNAALTKDAYFKKSKGQKTSAIILVSAGGGMLVAGLGVLVGDAATKIGEDFSQGLGGIFEPDPVAPQQRSKKHTGVAVLLIVAGAGALATGISLFISAHKNKVRAMSVSFKNDYAPQLKGNMVSSRSFPSLSLKVNL